MEQHFEKIGMLGRIGAYRLERREELLHRKRFEHKPFQFLS